MRVDGYRKDVEFEVGDKVFLKMRFYRRCLLVRRVNEKLLVRFYGSYKVVVRVGKVVYRLNLLVEVRIYSIFYVF